MIRIIKEAFPYYVMQDDSMIDQYCVMVRTGQGWSQQISRWYFRKGNVINKYNQILRKATNAVLDGKEVIY